jgi:hypothetical protein
MLANGQIDGGRPRLVAAAALGGFGRDAGVSLPQTGGQEGSMRAILAIGMCNAEVRGEEQVPVMFTQPPPACL